MTKTETCVGITQPRFENAFHCDGCIGVVGAEARKESAVLLTVVRILLEGKPVAAANAVREDYPEFAELIDRRKGLTEVTYGRKG